jgi:hypothetical protein
MVEVLVRGRRVDANHGLIRDQLRADGWEVLDTSGVGGGIWDLIVKVAPGWPHFLEVKDGDKPLSAQALTPAQEKLHNFCWQFSSKVTNINEARAALAWAANRAKEKV